MKGYVVNLEKLTRDNNNFRQVLYTAQHCQLVLMSLKPSEEIGAETHTTHDQFIRVEAGTGKAVLNGVEYPLADGSAVVIPAGVLHNIINTSTTEKMKLYTLYSPPEHRDGVVHATKPTSETPEEHFDGKTTEKNNN